MKGAWDVMYERGFIQQCSNETGLKELLSTQKVTFYVGFDPTGPSLHVGHLVPLMAMAHLQKAGHRPVALVGGGTARIGDPSGKTETRKMMTIDQIENNARSFRRQLARFLEFPSALMIDNAEWLAELNYITFLRDIGKHFSVNRMLSFEAYRQRMEKGLSFIEFNYQLLQAYDFLVLYRTHGCLLQMGGDDQWGNIVAGIELVRRIEGAEAFALTSQLVTRADGRKMGKTEKGALFLDPEMVSPYDFYQYWINVPDGDVGKFLRLYTFLPIEEIVELERLKGDKINRAKEILAFELTALVHGREQASDVQQTSQAAFGRGSADNLQAMPTVSLSQSEVEKGLTVLDLFVRTDLCHSRSEARRLIGQGGAYINDRNIDDGGAAVDREMIVDGVIMLRAGKKRYFKVVVD